ncbi:MAG: transcription-repair coupling factor [Phycisphaerales bacterium]|nr:transcription-repair coupling factor [Phycisphaerales bacterium]
MVRETIAADRQLTRLARELEHARKPLSVCGLWGSSAPMVAGVLARSTGRPVLYITAHLDDADTARDDLEFFLDRTCDLLSAWETLPGEGPSAGEIDAERHRLCTQLAGESESDEPQVIVAPVQALMQPVPTADSILAHTLSIATGQKLEPRAIADWLTRHRFERLHLVEAPGDFAVRGDILDVFAPGDRQPVRIEFFDNEVESIRRFELSTQRSTRRLNSVALSAPPELTTNAATAAFASYLPRNTIVLLDDPASIQEQAERFRSRLGDPDSLFTFAAVIESIEPFAQAHLSRFGAAAVAIEEPESPATTEGQVRAATVRERKSNPNAPTTDDPTQSSPAPQPRKTTEYQRLKGKPESKEDSAAPTSTAIDLRVRSLTRFEGKSAEAVGELLDLANTRNVTLVCENDGESKRLRELIVELHGKVPKSIDIVIGRLHRGFEWTATGDVVVAHHEVFHRHQPKRRIRRIEASRPLESWVELEPGDIVVHAMHGIARFGGIGTMRKGDSDKTEEYLTLEFAEKAVLHVPVSQIDLVQKYIGVGASRQKLSKLGGTRWSKTKERVSEAVAELAESLLRVQAAREASEGTAYPIDTRWQNEFEAAFPYEETEDQRIVAGEIKGDLSRQRSMDRLLCGDVGYGKTELAMRAAFKVCEFGKQVAVLVPTTVLAEQHYETFSERMAEYPFTVACLSRFRTSAEQKKIIEEARKGRVDVLIGTHRLLSKDVGFADLGLVIIDEEQRFGVEHKERLKQFRATVEVLTLTATPIPRTLHMALLGIRDISSLATPPVDRRSIATQVTRFDEQLVRNAIIREMNRDGQVFFVHNFVQSIHGIADRIRRIVPECRVLVGHGQMAPRELEHVMQGFVRREADVLVATTIIESGIDIPSVNTIFINRADRYGLSDLHQLRGRVGRSDHRAYCYLLLDPSRTLTPKAARRLKSIEEFSELGAGFRIAMRDLEIRGAGNILGPEQSGHITAVGYDMYCRLLDKAVRGLRDEPDPIGPPVHLEIGIGAYIPKSYIPSERSRIDIYRRTVACRTLDDLRQLETDVADAFGPVPQAVQRLMELAEIRVLARRWKIASIVVEAPDIIFNVTDLAHVQTLFADASGTVRMPDPRTVHLRLRDAYFEPPTLLSFLRRLLAKDPVAKETVA